MRSVLLIAVLALVACNDMKEVPPSEVAVRPPTEMATRVKVECIGRFPDSTAYSSERRIYLLTDTKTGKVYFTVTGCGTTQVGTHTDNKETKKHEE